MKRNSEIKIKVIECDSTSNLVVLQHRTKTFTFTDKDFCEFIKTAPFANDNLANPKKNTARFQIAGEVLEFLNERCSRKFEISEVNLKLIIARLEEGEEPELIKQVIDLKAWEWMDDFNMKKYLRPMTLFNKTKFQGYKQEVADIRQNPKAFKNYVTSKENEKRDSRAAAYDPLDGMP